MNFVSHPSSVDVEAAKICAFVAETLDVPVAEVDLDTDLAATGRLDSLAVVSIVSFIDDEYGVKVPVENLMPAHFSSIKRIMALAGISDGYERHR
jgi:acyl carrier protein